MVIREWCNLESGIVSNCHDFVAFAFIKAIEELDSRLGPDMVIFRLIYIIYSLNGN